jgi:Tol biopolymer transport system component
LTWSRGLDGAPRVSPDGEHIAFISSRSGAVRGYVMRRDGAKPRPIAGASSDRTIKHDDLRWSPDGSQLSFIEHQADRASLRIIDFPSGKAVRLDAGAWSDQTARWSPDSRHLVFASNRDGDTELYTVKRNGQGLRRITHEPGADWLPLWYRD